ncbi:MAG: TIGR03621 family F420-dependent LLM class oxidoreductase [Chloroflexota bacterium]
MTHPFRFGIISESMTTQEAWVTQAKRAETLGYATFLIRDHFVPDFFGDQFAPLIALMAAASATTKLRVGTLVIDNDYRHPVMLAKEAATLDLLSEGRLELGLGAGWLRTEYEQAGLPFDRAGIRIDRLAEAIQIIKGLWTDKAVSFKGEHYQLENLNGYPKPTQRPNPPLLIGAGKKRMLRLAGREADIVGLLTSSVSTGTLSNDPTERLAASVEEKLTWIKEGAGKRFSDIELSLCPTVIITTNREQHAQHFIDKNNWSDISVSDILEMPSVFIGSVDEIVEQMLQRRSHYGFSYYIVTDKEMEAFAPVVAQLANK